MYKQVKQFIFTASFIALALLVSCNSGDEKGNKNDPKFNPDTKGNGGGVININGKTFSIPSPVHMAEILQKSGIPFNSAYLNPSSAAKNYATNFYKALNLGVFGADLGYLTIYQKSTDATAYVPVLKQLADELGVATAFSTEFITKLQDNLANKDSLMILIGEGYQAANDFLKNEGKFDIAALILAGGWAESMYFMVSSVEKNKNVKVINRIGEQKTTLHNLIMLIEMNPTEGEQEKYQILADQLKQLEVEFEKIKIEYKYVQPEEDAQNQISTLKSTTTVSIDDAVLSAISTKLKEIRKQIVDANI